MHRFIALGLMALLAGCGSPSVDGTRPLSRQILDQSLALLKPKAAQAAPEPEVFTRASVTKDTTGPVILVSAPKLKAKASLNMITQNLCLRRRYCAAATWLVGRFARLWR